MAAGQENSLNVQVKNVNNLDYIFTIVIKLLPWGIFFFLSSVGENVAEGKVDIQKYIINKVWNLFV